MGRKCSRGTRGDAPRARFRPLFAGGAERARERRYKVLHLCYSLRIGGEISMPVFYQLAYAVGFTPWEEAASHPPARRQVEAIFDREASQRPDPPGRALDIGCGTGFWSTELARRGWDVTGIDVVHRALRKAQKRAEAAQQRVRFVLADLTKPAPDELRRNFDFLWDLGAIHGLSAAGREAAGRAVTEMAAPGATMALLAWRPARRGPLPRGASRDEIAAAFPAWEVLSDEPFDATGLPAPLRNVDPRVYRLRLATRA